jgi:hypothetical protein
MGPLQQEHGSRRVSATGSGAASGGVSVQIDAADAVSRGLKPEALRARVLADLAARSDAAGIIATAPAAAAAKDSPIIAAARKAATDAKR